MNEEEELENLRIQLINSDDKNRNEIISKIYNFFLNVKKREPLSEIINKKLNHLRECYQFSQSEKEKIAIEKEFKRIKNGFELSDTYYKCCEAEAKGFIARTLGLKYEKVPGAYISSIFRALELGIIGSNKQSDKTI